MIDHAWESGTDEEFSALLPPADRSNSNCHTTPAVIHIHGSSGVRERVMKRLASPGQAQRLLCAFGSIRQHFRPRRHLISGPEWRTEMTSRFAVWNQIITAAAV